MKIGFVGNTNNMPFIAAKFLHDHYDHEVVYFQIEKEPLCRPENIYMEYLTSYPVWIKDISAGIPNLKFFTPPFGVIGMVKELRKCDYVVLNGLAINFWKYIKRPACIFLTGSDIQCFAKKTFASEFQLNRAGRDFVGKRLFLRILLRSLINRQIEGISNADFVVFPPNGAFPNEDITLSELGICGDDRRKYFQYIAPEYYENMAGEAENDGCFTIFYASRLVWKKPFPAGFSDFDDKGTDVFLRGFAEWIKSSPHVRVQIDMVRKGIHISETVKLIHDLNLTQYIRWHDVMSQERFYQVCRTSHLIVDQIGMSVPGMITMTAIAMGKPVIVKVPELQEYKLLFGDAVCDVGTVEEVSSCLERLYNNQTYRSQLSLKAHQCAMDNFHPRKFVEYLLERAVSTRGYEK